jgi:hypothetical protein
MSKLISTLPQPIREIAEQRRKYGNEDNLSVAFTWYNTPEGHNIWSEVEGGNYQPFYDFHNIIDPSIITQEILAKAANEAHLKAKEYTYMNGFNDGVKFLTEKLNIKIQ